MNAGISQKYLVAAVCIGVAADGANEKLILNPNLDELEECTASLVVVLENKNYEMISFLHEGSLSTDQFDRALELARSACEDVFAFYKESVKRQFTAAKAVDVQMDEPKEPKEAVID